MLTLREIMLEENEHEIIERLVKFASPRTDANEIADRLLDTFGSMKNVIEARPEQVKSVKGVTPKIAEMFEMILPIVRQYESAQNISEKINNANAAQAYCAGLLRGLRNEEFWVIAVNAQCKVVGKRCISSGTINEVAAYPRSVVETALNYNAHSVLLCHNHPGGTCAPSRDDLDSTRTIQKLLNGLGILVLDHIIVAGAGEYSMAQHGDIDYRIRG